jgi:hypothetical protein
MKILIAGFSGSVNRCHMREGAKKAGAISRCKSGPGKAVAGRLEASVASGGGDAEYEAYPAVAWGVGLSHEMMNSRERRLSSWSNATCAMPSCEALSSRRGRRAHHAQKDRVGTWDISCPTTGNMPTWSASGRRGVVADDARAREVGLLVSSDETGEQSRAKRGFCGGVGGAKGRGQGECGPAKHASDLEPHKRVKGAGSHTATYSRR